MSRNRTVGYWLVIAVFAGGHSGCATIVSGRSHHVLMDNSGGPTYFSVFDSKNCVVDSGMTPKQVTLTGSSAPFRPARYRVVYAGQDGVQEQHLDARVNWWTAGNIVIGGVPGVVVDAATGALWRLQPNVTGQVPSRNVVSDTNKGAAVLAAHTGQDSSGEIQQKLRAELDVLTGRRANVAAATTESGKVREASFDRSGSASDEELEQVAREQGSGNRF